MFLQALMEFLEIQECPNILNVRKKHIVYRLFFIRKDHFPLDPFNQANPKTENG
jgi:hypothetical protein